MNQGGARRLRDEEFHYHRPQCPRCAGLPAQKDVRPRMRYVRSTSASGHLILPPHCLRIWMLAELYKFWDYKICSHMCRLDHQSRTKMAQHRICRFRHISGANSAGPFGRGCSCAHIMGSWKFVRASLLGHITASLTAPISLSPWPFEDNSFDHVRIRAIGNCVPEPKWSFLISVRTRASRTNPHKLICLSRK